MTDMFAALAAPFPPERVSWRVGTVKKDGTAAMALAYLDARDVMERLDEVCGPGSWQNRYTHADRKTICEVGILIGEEWVWKADGAGDSDIEAEKGALSDAFKRAAVRWGIGRYLYDVESPWVRIDQYKKILPEEQTRLRNVLARQAPLARPQPATDRPAADDNPPSEPIEAELRVIPPRKSSARANRDGDNAKLKAEIGALDKAGLAEWNANFDANTAHLPRAWLDPVRDMLESRLIELNGADKVREAEAELDDGFRGTVGVRGAGESRMAAGASQMAAE